MNKFYIPSEIVLGFKYSNTSTKKLAQITYKNGDKIFNQKNWEAAIDNTPKNIFMGYEVNERNEQIFSKPIHKKIEGFPTTEINNVPTRGFILNPREEGKKLNWDNKPTSCYFLDPRGFDVYVNFNNLLYIMSLTNDITNTEFIYSWLEGELILLPCNSQDYLDSIEFRDIKTLKISSKDLKKGHFYITKTMDKVLYMGHFNEYEIDIKLNYNLGYKRFNNSKSHIFMDEKGGFLSLTSTSIAKELNEVAKNYDELLEKLEKTGKILIIENIDIKPILLEDILQKERDIQTPYNRYYNYYNHNNRLYTWHFISYVCIPKENNKYIAYKLYQIRDNNSNASINNPFTVLGYKLLPSHQEYTIKNGNILVKGSMSLKTFRDEMNNIRNNNEYLTENQINVLKLVKIKLKTKNSDKILSI